MTEEELRQLQAWIDQHADAREQLDARTIAAVLAMYAGVNFYDRLAVEEAAEAAADVSDAASLLAAGLMAQYLATVTSIVSDVDIPTPAVLLTAPLRNGADMRRVFQRPAKLFRRRVAKGMTPLEAFQQAMELAAVLTKTNNTLAMRQASQVALAAMAKEAGITGYRRIVHPELARTGSCGLCIVASDQVYKTSMLMPLHARCGCTVLPIVGAAGGAGDPGNSLNDMSLGDFYTAAGGTTAGDELKKVRVVVREHGEYGPTLADSKQKFTDWRDLDLPARNAA